MSSAPPSPTGLQPRRLARRLGSARRLGLCTLIGIHGAGMSAAPVAFGRTVEDDQVQAIGSSRPEQAWSPLEQALFKLTNDYRARQGLARWQADPGLQALALAASRAMAAERRASHDGFHGRFVRSGASLCVEVIARGRISAERAVALWRRSPEHHRNLVEPRARWVGVAEVDGFATMLACDLPAR